MSVYPERAPTLFTSFLSPLASQSLGESAFCQLPLGQWTHCPTFHHLPGSSPEPHQGQVPEGRPGPHPSPPGRSAGPRRTRLEGSPQVRVGGAEDIAHFILPASGRIWGRSQAWPSHTDGQGLLSNLQLTGQLGQLTQHLCAPSRPQPTHMADIQPTPAMLFFPKPEVNQSETVFFPLIIFMVDSSRSWHVLTGN